MCRCEEEGGDSIPDAEPQHSGGAFAATAAWQIPSRTAIETSAVNNAVRAREEGAHAFVAPGTSAYTASSVGWSGSASSDGGFGPAQTPHKARLRSTLSAQLRVSAQHWSVSQVRSGTIGPAADSSQILETTSAWLLSAPVPSCHTHSCSKAAAACFMHLMPQLLGLPLGW